MKKSRLAVEELEDRTVPTGFGVAWPDAQHLTLSFVPDQAPSSGASDLFRTLDALAPPAVWQTQILRAFQTWAQYANINIGVVSDDGEALGVAGAPQGDTRFGDIRVAAFALNSRELALASPFDVLAGTNSGDVRLNSNDFTGAGSYDLFSVFLHEAGHVLGLDHSDNPASPMYPTYQGVRTGLTAGDVANLQTLYGARTPDAFDARHSNDTLETASLLSPAGQSPDLSADADLSTRQDVDWYRFKLNGRPGGLTIQLHTAGLSLLEGRLSVFDTAGHLVGSATAATPGSDLQIHLDQTSSATYYVKVEKATDDVFAIGSYQLDVTPDAAPAPQKARARGTPQAPTNPALGTTPQAPLPLQQRIFQTDARFDYAYAGSFAAGGGTEYFRLHAPQAQPGALQVMTVMAWATQPSGLQPRVTVSDAAGTPVAAEVLMREDGTFVLQIPRAGSNVDYVVAVRGSGTPGPAEFFLGVDFGSHAEQMTTFADNQVLGPGGTSLGSLHVAQGGLFHFVLSANAALQMQVFDSSGNLVRSLAVAANDPASLTVSLAAGNYFFRLSAAGATAPVQFTLKGTNLDDPIGPDLIDPTLAPLTVGGTSSTGSTLDAYSYWWDTSYYLFLTSTYSGSLTSLSSTDLTSYYAWLAWMSTQSTLTLTSTTTTTTTTN